MYAIFDSSLLNKQIQFQIWLRNCYKLNVCERNAQIIIEEEDDSRWNLLWSVTYDKRGSTDELIWVEVGFRIVWYGNIQKIIWKYNGTLFRSVHKCLTRYGCR